MIFHVIFFKRMAIVMMMLALPVFTSTCAAQTVSQKTDALGVVTDVIVGHNNKGPYSLSWTEVDPASVCVVLGGRTLRKGSDYNIDLTNGMISFNSMLLNDAIVRVSYKTIPGKSQANSGKLSVPVNLNLMQGRNGSLSVTGLYAQDDQNNPEAGRTVVGVGGDRAWSGGKVESLFLMSQRTDDKNANAEQASSWERSALKFGNTTNLGQLKLTGSFMRAGKEFAGSKEYAMESGSQAMDIAGAYDAGKSLQATFKFQNSEQTGGQNDGKYARVNEQGMTYAPTDATKISMAHSITESGNKTAEGSDRTVESNRLQINQNLGTNTSAIVSLENANITQGGLTDQVQTRQTSVTTSAVQGINVRGTVTQKDSQLNGAEQNVTAAVTVSPISQVAVQAGFTETDSEKSGKSATTNLSIKVNPLENVEVQGKLVDQSQNENQQFQRDLNLSATPIKNTKLTAQFIQRGMNETEDVTKGAALEVSPFDNTKVAAGFKSIESGASVMTIRDYSASSQPWEFFSFSGSLRDRQLEQELARDTKKLNLALSPLEFVKLTGDYQENPEDNKGNVQTYKATAMGMKLQVGSVGVLTNYTSKDEYLSSKLSDERQIGLEFRAFGHGKFNTGYKIKRLLDGSELSINTYSLGYEHSLGSDFSLSLTGYYSKFMQDQMATPQKAEYKSELNIGLKF
ncbi:MAG: hypothetical protein ACYC64_08715 [Armatimonadota bacterium]